MELEAFIRKTLSSIENASRANSKESKTLGTNKVDFDLNVIIKNKKLYVSTKKSDENIHIKFSINPIDKGFSLTELLDKVEKEQ